MLMLEVTKLQFITHQNARYSYLEGARMALEGGCRWIQLRMKGASDTDFLAVGHELKRLCRSYGARLIVDDRVKLVKALQADGVHLGKTDMPVGEARGLLGDGYIIGATANTLNDAVEASRAGADYIGCGPFRFTTTKQHLAPIIGIEGYKRIVLQLRNLDITTPLVAIGGITEDDIASIMSTGISSIALSGAILNAENPIEKTKRIIKRIEKQHRK